MEKIKEICYDKRIELVKDGEVQDLGLLEHELNHVLKIKEVYEKVDKLKSNACFSALNSADLWFIHYVGDNDEYNKLSIIHELGHAALVERNGIEETKKNRKSVKVEVSAWIEGLKLAIEEGIETGLSGEDIFDKAWFSLSSYMRNKRVHKEKIVKLVNKMIGLINKYTGSSLRMMEMSDLPCKDLKTWRVKRRGMDWNTWTVNNSGSSSTYTATTITNVNYGSSSSTIMAMEVLK